MGPHGVAAGIADVLHGNDSVVKNGKTVRPGFTALQTRSIRLTPARIARGGSSFLSAPGFLPGHPVPLLIDGKQVATLVAGDLGTVTFMIDPGQLGRAPGRHTIRLDSMLLTMTTTFTTK